MNYESDCFLVPPRANKVGAVEPVRLLDFAGARSLVRLFINSPSFSLSLRLAARARVYASFSPNARRREEGEYIEPQPLNSSIHAARKKENFVTLIQTALYTPSAERSREAEGAGKNF